MKSNVGRFERALKSSNEPGTDDEQFEDRSPDLFRSFCKQQRWRPCGLNADWAVDAYQINEAGQSNPRYGLLALDQEDGTYVVCFAMAPDKAEQAFGTSPWEGDYWDNPRTFKDLFRGDFEGFQSFCRKNDNQLKNYQQEA